MLGYQWGYWYHPQNYGVLFPLPSYDSYSEGTCANYSVLDLELLTDEDLAENVVYSIYNDPRISKTDKDHIKIESKEFNITLSGEAKNRSSKFFAYMDALQTPGVNDVDIKNLKINLPTAYPNHTLN
ncbi:MAG: BON domain-containing protein [Patescibacteria group bacterium]|nr:BON domain-containing protein [Patescibacteria group bacterium]